MLDDPDALFGLIHPEDRPGLHASGTSAVAALRPWHWEGRVVLPTGEERYVQVASRNERQPDGSILADGLLMDVTERRQAELRLEESEQRYRSLFEHHPDAVYSLDAAGRFLSANPACEAISGYHPDELVGQSFTPLLGPEHLPLALQRFEAALAGMAQSYELVIRHKTGRAVEIDITSIPIVVGGQVVGVFGIARDLSARRELEEQLRQSQKMDAVGQLAGGVAHDFNNLLMVILGHAALALENGAVPPAVVGDLEEIQKAASRAAALTRQLLAFSRRQLLQPRELDLNAVVAELAPMLQRLIGEDIAVVSRLDPALGHVRADRGQLEQVLMNLALNGRDAMPGGGTLTFETSNVEIQGDDEGRWAGVAPGRYVRLAVTDTGIGMTREVREHAFEPFFTTKLPGKGTGLGLATVYGILQQSGGHVRVESEPGRGSTFTVYLPLATAAEAPPSLAGPAGPTPRGHEVVLVVEDDDEVRRLVRRILQRHGYTVLEAPDGRKALEFVTAHTGPLDLVLTDMVMPELSGRLLAEHLAVQRPGLRVLHMSGYTDDEFVRRGLLDSGMRLLEKPFTVEGLARAVRAALDEEPARPR
jgi:PAS domain S-box-containing protein